MTRKTSKQLKFVAFIMSLVMLMTVAPLSAYAETGADVTHDAMNETTSGQETISEVEPAAIENAAALTAADVPEFIAMSDLTTRGTIRRVYEEEADLSTILFENNDGTRTLYMYGVPVKYVAPDGTTRDKSTAISSLAGLQALWNGSTLTPGQMTTLAQNASIGRLELGQAAEALSLMNTRLIATYGATLKLSDMAYASLDSDIRSLYPTAVSDGVVLNYGDYSIRTIPVATGSLVLPGAANVAESTSLTDNDIRTRVRYSNAFGLGTILQYTPTTMGVKEEIILTSNVGKNSFAFRIETGGLTIEEENGNYFFFDPATQRVIAQLGEIIAYDSNGQIARGAVTVQSVIAGQRYNVTISVSPEFLANAAYPVSVDPTTTIYATDTTSIQYASVYNTAEAWNYTFESFHVFGTETSYSSYGPTFVGRALFRFPGFNDVYFDYSMISSAQLMSMELKLPTTTNLSMSAYPAATNWSSGTRICDSSVFDYYDITYSGNSTYANGTVSVDLTSLAKLWIDHKNGVNTYTYGDLSYGTMIKLVDESQYCTVTAADISAVIDYSYVNFSGSFYLNSKETKTFLGGANTNTLGMQQGLIVTENTEPDINENTLTMNEADITWTFASASNGQYYIHPNGQTNKYLMHTGTVGTTPSAWTVAHATGIGSGVTITTGNVAFGATSAGISVSSTLSDDQKAWSLVNPSTYTEITMNPPSEAVEFTPTTRYTFKYLTQATTSTFDENGYFKIVQGLSHVSTDAYGNVVPVINAGRTEIEVEHIPTGQKACVMIKIRTIPEGMYFIKNSQTQTYLTSTASGVGVVTHSAFLNNTTQVWNISLATNGYVISTSTGINLVKSGISTLPATIYTESIFNNNYEVQYWDIISTGDSSDYIIHNIGAYPELPIVLAANTSSPSVSQSFQSSITDNSGVWELYPYAEYTVYHYYDDGYVRRHGGTIEEIKSTIAGYQEQVSLKIGQVYPVIIKCEVANQKILSSADNCKAIYANDASKNDIYLYIYSAPEGGTSIASPDCPDCMGATPCAYHAICNDCDGNDKCLVHTHCPDNYGSSGKTKMHQYSIACSFVEAIGDFDVTPDRTRVFWTGHITEGSYNNDIYRRSGSYIPEPNEDQTLNRVIIMTPYKTATREIPHEALTEQEILEGNVGTLLHELSHQMNASDHYCLVYDTVAEMREVDTPCDNDRCPICNYQVDNEADAKNRGVEMPDGYWNCAMIDSANNTHCEACKEDIIEYIKQNLEQSEV